MSDQKDYKAGFLWRVLIIAGIFVFCAGTPEVKAGDPTQELIRASMAGDFQKVERLLREGANVIARFKDGFTALMLASPTNRPEIAKLFLRKGVDVNARTSHGVSALIWRPHVMTDQHEPRGDLTPRS